tara:strand:- start:518 stop:832 length:315 start_codon:yes stop_codon:yes gene_type:complete
LSKSLPRILTRKLIGVKIVKKINAIIIGAIIFPRISPNLTQELFNGLNIFGRKKDKTKNIIAKHMDHTLIEFKLRSGHKPIKKKNTEKITPKFLSEDLFMKQQV